MFVLSRRWAVVPTTLIGLLVLSGCVTAVPAAKSDSQSLPSATPTAVATKGPIVPVTPVVKATPKPRGSATYEAVADKHRVYGLDIPLAEWQAISKSICLDAVAGLPGKYLSSGLGAAPEAVQSELVDYMWTAAIFETCPGAVGSRKLSLGEQKAETAFDRDMITALGADAAFTSEGSLTYQTVEGMHQVHGLHTTQFEWKTISESICADAWKGLPAKKLSPELKAASPETQDQLVHVMWAAALYESCGGARSVRALTWKESDSESYFLRLLAITMGYGNSGTSNVGGGSTVQCVDGSLSTAGGIQGACSHHGGVR